MLFDLEQDSNAILDLSNVRKAVHSYKSAGVIIDRWGLTHRAIWAAKSKETFELIDATLGYVAAEAQMEANEIANMAFEEKEEYWVQKKEREEKLIEAKGTSPLYLV
jgi:hypothetical protein